MEIEITTLENGINLSKHGNNHFELDFLEVERDSSPKATLIVRGATIVNNRTTCQCTIADSEQKEGYYSLIVTVKTRNKTKIKQRVTLTTDEALEIYIDVVGVIKEDMNEL